MTFSPALRSGAVSMNCKRVTPARITGSMGVRPLSAQYIWHRSSRLASRAGRISLRKRLYGSFGPNRFSARKLTSKKLACRSRTGRVMLSSMTSNESVHDGKVSPMSRLSSVIKMSEGVFQRNLLVRRMGSLSAHPDLGSIHLFSIVGAGTVDEDDLGVLHPRYRPLGPCRRSSVPRPKTWLME